MARLNVNPTRMEMTRLKKQLKTATKGHKLLKDKLDELMKQFLDIVKENKNLREEAEAALEKAYKSFIIARGVMSEEYIGEALMMPKQKIAVDVSKRNIMSVNVPQQITMTIFIHTVLHLHRENLIFQWKLFPRLWNRF